MSYICGLHTSPIFSPIVADYYAGMEVSVPLFLKNLKGNLKEIQDAYKAYYPGPLVHFDDAADEAGFLSASAFAGRDDMQIIVTGNEDRAIVTARFDNLGKGASGAAIQNLNLVLGFDETESLVLGE